MSEGIALLKAPPFEDLNELSLLLWKAKIAHRILLQDEFQWLFVDPSADLDAARKIVSAWKEGDMDSIAQVSVQEQNREGETLKKLYFATARAPVTALLMVFSLIGYGVAGFLQSVTLIELLTFQPFAIADDGLEFLSPIQALEAGELWRLITPVFLHFSVLHICFNMLWLWILGACLESHRGGFALTGIVLLCGVVSNTSQWLAGGGLFGGMSGVIYALLGYCWLQNRFWPGSLPCVSNGIFVFMVGWLLVCLTGFMGLVGFGQIANAAHVSGLISGLLLALIFRSKRPSAGV